LTDALVIGGGLAGSAVAILLARQGRSVVLLEREAKPHHKVCGEFLSREAVHSLSLLDIDVTALGAVPIGSVRFGSSEVAIGFTGQSLSRWTLDESLLAVAARTGVTVVRGQEALDPGRFNARTTFLATGKYDLPQHRRPPGQQHDLIGFKMYWRLQEHQRRRLEGLVELNHFNGGYYGLQNVESGQTNLCLVVRKKILRGLGGRWPELLEVLQQQIPTLAAHLQGATPLWAKPLAIAPIPYGFRRQTTEPNLWPLGDQAAVIASFAGNGMSIALRSAEIAARHYLAGQNSSTYLDHLNRELRRPVQLATRVSQALVLPRFATVAETVVHRWPQLLPFLARQTRLP
jgi:menaquinone-9 beta-reductase